jgi:ComF family protein
MAASRQKALISGIFEIISDFLKVLLPSVCCVCSRESKEKICCKCRSKFIYIKPPFCRLCGIPLNNEDAGICEICSLEKPLYLSSFSIFRYESELRASILKMKYHGEIDIAPALSSYLTHYIEENMYLIPFDLIVPVPKGGIKEEVKINNPGSAEILCSYINNEIYTIKNILIRTRETKPQNTLNFKDRWSNVEGAFSIKEGVSVKNKRVLLIDDIFTTGATVSNCTKALLEGEAREVRVLTLARAIPNGK